MRPVYLALTFILFLAGCAPQPTPPSPATKSVTVAELARYSYDDLALTAAALRDDGRTVDDFGGFITAMKASVADYADMIKASAYLSNVVRVLPIPYAGEASTATKLASNTLLHLGNAAAALDRYKKSSAAFLYDFDRLDRATATPEQIARLAAFADDTVMNDARDLQTAMGRIASATAGMATAAQTVSRAMETTGDYLDQAKNLVGMQPSPKEKARAAADRDSFKARLIQLNQKIAALENSADAHRRTIAKARAIAELAVLIDRR